jgi:hypothetical protein
MLSLSHTLKPTDLRASRARRTAAAALVLVFASIATARADDVLARQVHLDIQAAPLSSALIQLSAQAGVQVAASDTDLSHLQAAPLKGDYTLEQALQRLLARTGLTFSPVGAGTIVIRSSATTALSAARELLRAAVRENGGEGGLARWPRVCPLVSGLPQAEGEFILGRLSETARAAGVPLAGEQCRPNLYILVSSSPRQLLEAMDRRNRAFTFSCEVRDPGRGASPSEIDEVIQKPRAVRVWYNTAVTTPDGVTYCADRADAGVRNAWASRLQYNVGWLLYTVFVVVDTTRIQGVTRGQLADYVSLVGLARMNPEAPLDGAPTILQLFGSNPGAAPAGLTVWDRAFLKVLYADKQALKLEPQKLARRMTEEVGTLNR